MYIRCSSVRTCASGASVALVGRYIALAHGALRKICRGVCRAPDAMPAWLGLLSSSDLMGEQSGIRETTSLVSAISQDPLETRIVLSPGLNARLDTADEWGLQVAMG